MPASKAQRAATAERRTKAVKLRIAGADWDTIKTQCGYASRGAACTDVTRAMEARVAEMNRNVDVLLHMEVERADRLQAAFWAAALQGDTDAARIVLGCIDRRVKWQRLQPPQRFEIFTLGAVEAEIARLEREALGVMPTPEQLVEPAASDL